MTKQAVIESCGETLAMHSEIDWVDALLQEGNDGASPMSVAADLTSG